jgi:hypothetical protein
MVLLLMLLCMDKQKLIPEQVRGKQLDLLETKDFPDRSSAEKAFRIVCDLLLHPALWKELSGEASASFIVMAEKEKIDRPLQTGDVLRIDIPGPGTDTGDGYDWVRVTLITSDLDNDIWEMGIRLEPTSNPDSKDTTAAHFFKAGSSSTLQIVLKDKTIEIHYQGRNEVINNETGKLADDVRNTVVGAGAKAGLSRMQWKSLLEGLRSRI